MLTSSYQFQTMVFPDMKKRIHESYSVDGRELSNICDSLASLLTHTEKLTYKDFSPKLL